MTAPGMEEHWEGQGRVEEEDLVGPRRSHIGLSAGPREPGQGRSQDF